MGKYTKNPAETKRYASGGGIHAQQTVDGVYRPTGE